MQEDLYRQICETSNQGIWVIDAEACTVFANAHLEEMLGYAPGEPLGKSLFDFVFPEDHDLFRAKLEARRNGSREQCDLRFRRKDGTELRAIVGANPLFAADGEFRGVFGIVTDVTERWVKERQRDHSQEALRSFFEFNPDAVYVVDVNGNLQDVNPAAERLTGYTRAELLASSWQSVVAPEDLPQATEALGRALTGSEVEYELTVIHREGYRIPVSGCSFPLKTDGAIAGVYGVVRDVSARKRMEINLQLVAAAGQALSCSLNYQETLNRAARVPLPVLGDWCIVATASEPGQVEVTAAAANPLVERQFIGGQELSPDLFSPDSPLARVATGTEVVLFQEADEALLTAIAGNPETVAALRELAPCSFLCAPLRDHGRQRGVLVLARSHGSGPFTRESIKLAQDLAHLAAVALENAYLHQELRRADANKDQFLTTLGHELRNPLAAIRSGVEVLRRCGTNSVRGEHALRSIERQVRHEARLLEDLLNVARIARGKVLMRFEHVELTRLICATLDDYRDALEENGLTLEIVSPETPLWVTGDPTRLAQVFANLLHNAIKFTDSGGTIRVNVAVSSDGHWVCVAVEDTGVGMDPLVLSRLFEMFTQGERTRERSRGGLGLGLALVKGLVEIHGGEVTASSPGPGLGARFTVTLPLQSPPGTPPGSEAPAIAPISFTEPHRVLVVDDNRAVAESMSELLQLMGYETRAVFTGTDGVRAAAEYLPHVVICDLGLPGLSGYQVAACLRSDPTTAGALLIALTGEGSEDSATHALAAGFDQYLLKPFEPADLQRLLDAFLLEASEPPA
ncbi:MAG: PAS domain S-box protein [Actinomycetota bacterium]